MTTAVVLGVACAIAVGLWGYQHFSGENPILDSLYDLWLRRQDLDTLDRRNIENQRRADVVVTLTTLPSRIDRIAPTIKSLLNQTVSPSAIRLNVPVGSRREHQPYVIPEWLGRVRSLTIWRCDDFGPATKLLPTLATARPDDCLVVVDDDRIYHRDFVEQMVRHADAHPDIAVAGSGWDAPDDLTDRPTTLMATLAGRPPAPIKCTRVGRARAVDIMQGLSGYLVRPRFFDVAALANYSGAPAAAFLVDDVWISGHCRVPKMIFKGRRTNFQSLFDGAFYRRTSLGRVNRGDGTLESRSNTIMLRYFKDRWKTRR